MPGSVLPSRSRAFLAAAVIGVAVRRGLSAQSHRLRELERRLRELEERRS